MDHHQGQPGAHLRNGKTPHPNLRRGHRQAGRGLRYRRAEHRGGRAGRATRAAHRAHRGRREDDRRGTRGGTHAERRHAVRQLTRALHVADSGDATARPQRIESGLCDRKAIAVVTIVCLFPARHKRELDSFRRPSVSGRRVADGKSAMLKRLTLLALLSIATPLPAEDAKSFDAAAAFGARPSVSGMTLSPDGQSVAYLAPTEGQGSVAYTLSLTKGASPKVALRATGKPERLRSCAWASNERLVCTASALIKDPQLGFLPVTRVVAANADGSNFQLLSRRDSFYTHGMQLGGGYVIDYLPEETGAVLMTRVYLPDDKMGSHLGSSSRGLGVDWIDTRNLTVRQVEPPREAAAEYISDGRGTVRIMAVRQAVGTGTSMYQVKG